MCHLRLISLVLLALLVTSCAPLDDIPAQPVATPTPAPVPRTPTPDRVSTPAPEPTGPSPGSAATETAPEARADELPEGEDVVVERIVDGDTIVVDGGQRVRLTGIDTPETVHPQRPVECFGREASAHLAGLIPAGTPIRLESDVQETDRYGRILAYVWRRDDALHVNLAMVLQGYAQVYTVPPNVRYQEIYLEAQRRAREEGRGLWAACPEGG